MVLAKGGEYTDPYFKDSASSDRDMHEGMVHEIKHTVEPEEPLDRIRAEAAIEVFFKRWVEKHPNIEIKYQEVREATEAEAERAGLNPAKSYTVRTQAVNHGANPEDFSPEVKQRFEEVTGQEPMFVGITIGLVALAIGTAVYYSALAVGIAIAAAAISYIGLWTVWRMTDFLRPDKIVCPKDGKEFESWDNFELHFRQAHPNQEVPPKPTPDWQRLLMLAGVGVGGALAFRIAYPTFTGD